jgi:membrane-associated protease RseP (regulator of RpoE activity)
MHSWSALGAAIRHHPVTSPVVITVQRGGKDLTLRATLAVVHGRSGSYLGISSSNVFQRVGPLRAVTYAGSSFGQVITGSVTALGQLPAAILKLFAKNRASTAGGNVSSIVGAANDTGQALSANIDVASKITIVLLIIISLNIFVGAFNLLPLLPLDGGHLAVVIYERARAWLARLRRRPDPGLVDMTRLVPLSFGVFAILVFVGLMLIMADILNPVRILQ